jgi:hypothetical protein
VEPPHDPPRAEEPDPDKPDRPQRRQPKTDKQKGGPDPKKPKHGEPKPDPNDGGGGGGGARPRKGRPLSAKERGAYKTWFPAMDLDKAEVTGEIDTRYNCMSLTLGITDHMVWPSPGPGSPTHKPQLDAEYAKYGFVPVKSGGSIAVWGDRNGNIRHVSKILPDGRMESKFDARLRIIHRREDMAGRTQYGEMQLLYYYRDSRRQRESEPGSGLKARGAPQFESLLMKLREGQHQVLIDGKPLIGEQDVREGAALLAGLDRSLVADFRRAVKEAEREAAHRREIWENPLTRPSGREAADFGVHFTLSIDSTIGHVDWPEWSRCVGPDCPENAHRGHR